MMPVFLDLETEGKYTSISSSLRIEKEIFFIQALELLISIKLVLSNNRISTHNLMEEIDYPLLQNK